MPRITLVRHGQAAAGWGDDLDPGLSPVGRSQAEATADALASIGPQPIVCSPLRRCRETSAPLAARWAVESVIDAGVGEIVFFVRGKEASFPFYPVEAPVDAGIVGIVDHWNMER